MPRSRSRPTSADSRGAQLGLPEISIGNFLGGGVTWLPPRLVGLAKARELVFLGERIGGEGGGAHRAGERVFADAGFLDEGAPSRQDRRQAPFSMELAKRQLNLSAERARSTPALVAGARGHDKFVGTTRDWQEGVDAFAEKRAPVFSGE